MTHQEILAAVRIKGSTLAALSREYGYRPNTLQTALHKRWPNGHAIIATFLGKSLHEIWPTFYGPDQQLTPVRKRARRAA